MNPSHWHPMMVHFPLALTLIAMLCFACARLPRLRPLHASLATAGSWNLVLGGAGVLITLVTGLVAVLHLQLADGAQYSVSRHVIWAICSSQLIALLALWRGLASPLAAPPGWLFLTLLFIACGGLIVTGYYGGENVYHYALGVGQHT
jgi:uncharacterized membrane protein